MYKTGFGSIEKPQEYQVLYQRVLSQIDPLAVLEHYGARNIYQHNDELIHSCLIDTVHPHHSNGDESPSAALNVEKKLYSCFSYGGGDIVWLIQEMENIDRAKALKFLGKFLSDDYEDDAFLMLDLVKAKFAKGDVKVSLPTYSEIILRPWLQIHPYMTESFHDGGRMISEDVLMRYKVGFDDEEMKVVLPLFWKGKLVGFQKRRLEPPWVGFEEGTPKYKNSSDFPKDSTLYNWDTVKERKLKDVVVVESILSVLRAETLGFTNVLSTMGGKVTKEQIELLKEFSSVTIVFDNDAGGWGGTIKLFNGLKNFCKVKIVESEPGVDLADMWTKSDVADLLATAKMGSLVVNRFIKLVEGYKNDNQKVRAARRTAD